MALTRPNDPPAPEAEPLPLTPEVRARPGAAGVPLSINGRAWFLAWGTLARPLDDLRDAIFKSLQLRNSVPIADAMQAAWSLLAANYNLAEPEVAALLTAADEKSLVGAVLDALFGFEKPEAGYSDWVRIALYSGGLDPAKIPAEYAPIILDHLVRRGVAPAVEDLIPAVKRAQENAKVKALIGAQRPRAAQAAAGSVAPGRGGEAGHAHDEGKPDPDPRDHVADGGRRAVRQGAEPVEDDEPEAPRGHDIEHDSQG